MKMSQVLTLARPLLARDRTEFCYRNRDRYICLAIDHARHSRGISLDDKYRTKVYVSSQLGGVHSLEGWLLAFKGIDATKPDPVVFEKLQTTRLAWLDHMIAVLKRNGD